MAYIVMFDQKETIQFGCTESSESAHRSTCDWRFLIRNPLIGHTYRFRCRVVYKPFVSEQDVYQQYQAWDGGLPLP
jgi:hypothetical protein